MFQSAPEPKVGSNHRVLVRSFSLDDIRVYICMYTFYDNPPLPFLLFRSHRIGLCRVLVQHLVYIITLVLFLLRLSPSGVLVTSTLCLIAEPLDKSRLTGPGSKRHTVLFLRVSEDMTSFKGLIVCWIDAP